MIDQTVSHYVVLESLGAGGVGMVYKARDTQLDRLVALKVLRTDKAVASRWRDRFAREAQLASSLNHPNIITIFEVGGTAGIQFIAMEWVKGKTLADLMAHGRLPLGEALAFAVQIADALAAAHAAGITHCDVKPANVMVTEDGLVKVLDFGLSRLLTKSPRPDNCANTMELDSANPSSAAGGFEGTPAYMSPEQSEGKELDRRTDIFSFGTVLYEMVTGEPAFQSDTIASTLAEIRHGQPEAVNSIVPSVPREIVWIIARCMRKDAKRRFQRMGDIYATLEDVKEDYEAGRMGSKRGEASASAEGSSLWGRWCRPLRYAAAGTACVIALVASGWWLTSAKAPEPDSNRVLSRLTWDLGLSTDPALSADGRLVAYASDNSQGGNLDIWCRHATGGQAIRLTHDPADDREPAFDPSGSRVAFRSERDNGGIYVVSIFGGSEQLIASLGRRPRFSPDGEWIAYWVRDPQTNWGRIFTVPSSGGPARPTVASFPDAHSPIWSPDGKLLLFCGTSAIRSPSQDSHDWWVVDLQSAAITQTGAFAAFRRMDLPVAHAPGGWFGDHVVFPARAGDSRNLWQFRISSKTRQAVGAPIRLTFGTGVDSRPFVTGTGDLAFASGSSTTGLWSLPIDVEAASAAGQPQRLGHLGGTSNFSPSLSLTGNKCVFVSDREGHDEVWVHDFRSARETVLTASSPEERAARKEATTYTLQPSWPILSRDGSQVAYRVLHPSRGPNRQRIYVVPAAGGDSRRVCDDCGGPTGWSTDGHAILFEPGLRRTPISLLHVPTGDQQEILTHPTYALHQASFAPDDRWIVFHADLGGGRMRVYIASYRVGAPTPISEWVAVTDGNAADFMPRWSADGNTVYFLSSRNGALSIHGRRLAPSTKLPSGDPFVVHRFADSRHPPSAGFLFAVSRDKIVFSLDELSSNVWMTRLSTQD